MSRRFRVLVGLLALSLTATLVGATAVIAAAKHHKTGAVAKATDEQTIVWRTAKRDRVYVTSTKWQVLPMPSGGCQIGGDMCVSSSFTAPFIFSKGPISLTFSGVFTRAPVQIRFRDGDHLMKPGAVKFHPQPGSNAFSFSFVSARKGERVCVGPQMEWRSPTGAETRLIKATIVVHYKKFEPKQQVGCV